MPPTPTPISLRSSSGVDERCCSGCRQGGGTTRPVDQRRTEIVFELPDLVTKDKALFELMKSVHFVLNKALLALVVLHVAAAVKHHYVDRDDVLARMVPYLKPRR